MNRPTSPRLPLALAFLAMSAESFAQEPEKTPSPPDYKLVYWFDWSDPVRTFRHRAYDLLQGEYPAEAVSSWKQRLRQSHPSYAVLIRDVRLADLPGKTDAEKLKRGRAQTVLRGRDDRLGPRSHAGPGTDRIRRIPISPQGPSTLLVRRFRPPDRPVPEPDRPGLSLGPSTSGLRRVPARPRPDANAVSHALSSASSLTGIAPNPASRIGRGRVVSGMRAEPSIMKVGGPDVRGPSGRTTP